MSPKVAIFLILLALTPLKCQAAPAECGAFQIAPKASLSLAQVSRHNHCRIQFINGLPAPDRSCSPGAINPTVTLEILRDPRFRTRCIRNQATSEDDKKEAYDLYDIPKPAHNFGPNQVCELDHIVPLQLGGSDALENIFVQCGRPEEQLEDRAFKRKDTVENYLTWLVKAEKMDLRLAQISIAENWTQFLSIAERICPGGRCPNLGK